MLSARLGDHLVLARPGPQPGQRLQVLDPLAAWIWESHNLGWSQDQIAAELATHFALTPDRARAEVAALVATWSEPQAAATWRLRLADQQVALTLDDPVFAERLGPLLPPQAEATAAPPDARLHLAGDSANWRLLADDRLVATGWTLDAALEQTRTALLDAGCASPRRLLVLHAAGVSRAGQGLVLIGVGGAGKTTLATALNTQGWSLLGDDVIPVTLDGQLLGLGLGPCLKAGSWPVLAPWLPALYRTPVIDRLHQPVRIPPAPGPLDLGPVPTGAFLLPHYRPGRAPALRPVTPVTVLQAILAAEAVLPTLDQSRLEALTRWVGSAPGFALTYPDLEWALDLVAGLALGVLGIDPGMKPQGR